MEQESLRRFRQKMSIQNKRVFPLLYPGREFPAMELRLERIYEKFCSIFPKLPGYGCFLFRAGQSLEETIPTINMDVFWRRGSIWIA